MSIKEELTKFVGADYVFDDASKLDFYAGGNSFSSPGKPGYIVQPKSSEEVQSILKFANKNKLPVIPFSSGVHLYGNTSPLQSGIILDMMRMNRILSIDERNRMVRIEPGVTWGQLQDELKKYDLMAVSPLLPHPLKSALTVFLEREPVLIPKFEYTDTLVTMEVVLPDGEIFRTGSACVPGFPDKSISDGANPSGPGDFMWNRIFQGAQGTLGVVTWANCKIEYRPKLNKTLFIPFNDLADAVNFIYKIQRREVGEECLLLNKTNLAAILTEKWPEDFQSLSESLSPWTLIHVMGGGKRLPEEKIEYEEDALKEVAEELSIESLPTSLPGCPGIEKHLPDMLRTCWPEGKNYWKFCYKGSCQEIFFLTKLNEAQNFYSTIRETAAKHNYPEHDMGIYVQPMVYGGACYFECNFYYDSSNDKEVKSIKELYMESAEAVLEKGGFFSRPYGPVADMVYSRTTSYTSLLKKLKKVLDPNSIMSPGRLCY